MFSIDYVLKCYIAIVVVVVHGNESRIPSWNNLVVRRFFDLTGLADFAEIVRY